VSQIIHFIYTDMEQIDLDILVLNEEVQLSSPPTELQVIFTPHPYQLYIPIFSPPVDTFKDIKKVRPTLEWASKNFLKGMSDKSRWYLIASNFNMPVLLPNLPISSADPDPVKEKNCTLILDYDPKSPTAIWNNKSKILKTRNHQIATFNGRNTMDKPSPYVFGDGNSIQYATLLPFHAIVNNYDNCVILDPFGYYYEWCIKHRIWKDTNTIGLLPSNARLQVLFQILHMEEQFDNPHEGHKLYNLIWMSLLCHSPE